MIRTILKGVRDRIASRVPELKYVDRDWGQLYASTAPAVSFPCALVDLQSVDYTTMHSGRQHAAAVIAVTVADMRLTSESARSRTKEDGFGLMGLMAGLHSALHLWNGEGLFSPLTRRRTEKVAVDTSGMECYTVMYSVTFDDNSMIQNSKFKIKD